VAFTEDNALLDGTDQNLFLLVKKENGE
jgi:hypothetical protein